jgi:hypothetical protein
MRLSVNVPLQRERKERAAEEARQRSDEHLLEVAAMGADRERAKESRKAKQGK